MVRTPELLDWILNRHGCIKGIVKHHSMYDDDDAIITSILANMKSLGPNQYVTTKSGSANKLVGSATAANIRTKNNSTNAKGSNSRIIRLDVEPKCVYQRNNEASFNLWRWRWDYSQHITRYEIGGAKWIDEYKIRVKCSTRALLELLIVAPTFLTNSRFGASASWLDLIAFWTFSFFSFTSSLFIFALTNKAYKSYTCTCFLLLPCPYFSALFVAFLVFHSFPFSVLPPLSSFLP